MMEELDSSSIFLVEIDKIRPNRYNPNEMSEEEFNTLVENMRREGPPGTNPLEIRPLDASTWEIIDGFHRHKGAKLLGWKKIRCTVREVDEDRAQEINYAKNKLRGHINPWKEAEMFSSAWRKFGSQEAVAKKFGVTRNHVVSTLALGKIPSEIREKIPHNTNRSILEVLASIEGLSEQKAFIMKIFNGITVRQAEYYLRKLKQTEESEEPTFISFLIQIRQPNDINKSRIYEALKQAGIEADVTLFCKASMLSNTGICQLTGCQCIDYPRCIEKKGRTERK